jgi:dolichyl-phosphate-mannose-protein mannosyltransferase
VVHLLEAPTDRRWMLLGVLLGIGFLNRHAIVFLAAGLAVGLLATRARRLLVGRGALLAAGIAGAFALPHLVWQATHGWPTLEFLANARANKMIAKSPIEFVGEQILVLDPLAAPIWMTGLVVLWRREDGRWRPVVWAYATVLALLVAGGGKAYYLTPFYPVLFAAGAIALVERSRTLAAAATIAVVVSGVALAPFAKPLMSEEAFVDYSRHAGIDPRTGVGERNALDVLPQQYADQHGWPELATTVAGVLKTLPREEQERACIVTANYGEAGAIDFFGPALGLPPARSGHDSYWLWGPGDCDFSTVIAVGFDADIVRALARSVDEAASVPCPYCMPYERKPILLVRGVAVGPDALWARLKRFQ